MSDSARSIFSNVADLSPAQRANYFDTRRVEPDVRASVEKLLASDAESAGFAVKVAASVSELLARNQPSAGLRCGPYRLVRQIGSGGMGSVHLAERADGEVEHRAAVKLLHYGDAPGFRERFLQERRILARLDHPAIARLLDAGHTESGQPYLAMDFVEGVPIDEYASKLNWQARVRLFQKVCDAVSYAHRNLVVHRDLKPSNILVNAEGQPKLLDFGIARVLDAAGQTSTVTAMTPQYASPEQVSGTPVATATDIYSLGVVLYKILTGRLPYDVPSEASPATMARAICEAEPAALGVTPDIDRILLMALRKEPERRYLSVQEFSDDLSRALANQPVAARTPTLRYRATKFVERNRRGVAAVTLAAVGVVVSAGIAVQQWRDARHRFQDVRNLAHTFVFDIDKQLVNVDGSTQARETIVRTGLEYLDNLARTSRGDASLQEEAAMGYARIGEIQGAPDAPNLGHAPDAIASFAKAEELYRRLPATDPALLIRRGEFYGSFGAVLRAEGDRGRAGKAVQAAIESYEKARALVPLNASQQASYASALCNAAEVDEDENRFKQAYSGYARCAEVGRAALARERTPQTLAVVGTAEERLATSAEDLGNLTEALHTLDENQVLLEEQLRLEPRNPKLWQRKALIQQFRSMLWFDDEYPNFGEPARAMGSAGRFLEFAQELVARDPNDSWAQNSRVVAHLRLALVLSESDPGAAVQEARAALSLLDGMIASGKNTYLISRSRIEALNRLGLTELKAGRLADARSVLAQALAAQRKSLASAIDRETLVEILLAAARVESAYGNFTGAHESLDEALKEASDVAKSGELNDVTPLAMTHRVTGDVLVAQKRPNDARAAYRRLADLWNAFPEASEYVVRQRALAARLVAGIR